MSDYEMRTVWLYYAERDHWVGVQREVVQRALRGTSAGGAGSPVDGYSDIPYGFCMSEESSLYVFVKLRLLAHETIAPR
jgi:hypothetical protein